MTIFDRVNIRALHRLPYRFQDNIIIDIRTGCWFWKGKQTTGNGYSKTYFKGHNRVVHRVIYSLLVETVLDNKRIQLDHLCRTRGCCNPAHLEPVSPKVNTHRGNAVLYRKDMPCAFV